MRVRDAAFTCFWVVQLPIGICARATERSRAFKSFAVRCNWPARRWSTRESGLIKNPFCCGHLDILGTFVDCPHEVLKLTQHSRSIDLEIRQSVIRAFAGARAFVFYETLRCVSFCLIPMVLARANCGAQLVLPGGNVLRR
jgi:hypothetical protein